MKKLALKTMREMSGKTQKEIADGVNLNLRLYQKYESGTGAKTIQTAIRIAQALNTTVENLWGGNPDEGVSK